MKDGAPLLVRRATESDVAFVMKTERASGYAGMVGHWDERHHRAALADAHHAYFVARREDRPVGFTIIRDWGSAERVSLVKRMAVVVAGRGDGRAMLSAVVDAVFLETDAHRVWLGVFPDNARAIRSYAAVGFRPEGIARGAAFIGGAYKDELVMAILRPEWEARTARSA